MGNLAHFLIAEIGGNHEGDFEYAKNFLNLLLILTLIMLSFKYTLEYTSISIGKSR